MKAHLPFWATMIGSGFGSGFWPWGPGTMGALLATIVWLVLSLLLDSFLLPLVTFAFCVVFTLLGTWAVSRLEPYWGEDPGKVVVDEMVGVWIALLVCPHGHVGYALAAFVLFRFFDIVKPLGVRRLDRMHGAFWVMADDILAGIYAALVIVLARWVI